MYNLTGRTALVSGGARGIGRAIIERLLAEGAKAVIGDIDAPAGEALASELGPNASFIGLDVTSESDWAAAVAHAESFGGQLDILVNNAGIAGKTIVSWETPLEEWHRVIGIDLTGTFLGCKAALPGMVEREYGRIVNIASVAGKIGNQNAVSYSSAKSGVIGLTKSIAKDVMTKGVLINCIAPAAIETEISKQVSPAHWDYIVGRVPMGRAGRVEEVAALTAWLCSDEVSFSNGATYDISGGLAHY
ncbi:MAG: SDR family oxidoreductase [Thermomicrobiales bacterium]|nr:SDR family oxidoreductase [Thermomicrobiales bacterium]